MESGGLSPVFWWNVLLPSSVSKLKLSRKLARKKQKNDYFLSFLFVLVIVFGLAYDVENKGSKH
jgi:hypothetical protein